MRSSPDEKQTKGHSCHLVSIDQLLVVLRDLPTKVPVSDAKVARRVTKQMTREALERNRIWTKCLTTSQFFWSWK